MAGTFLYVRLKQNPEHYRLEGDTGSGDPDERLDRFCHHAISLLQEYNLVNAETSLKATEFGDAMARYYVQFETMRIFLGLPSKAKPSEIVSFAILAFWSQCLL